MSLGGTSLQGLQVPKIAKRQKYRIRKYDEYTWISLVSLRGLQKHTPGKLSQTLGVTGESAVNQPLTPVPQR